MRMGGVNRKHQKAVRKTNAPSTTHPYAKIWVMRCGLCKHEYGCNGCDADGRRCPYCQGGARGEPIGESLPGARN